MGPIHPQTDLKNNPGTPLWFVLSLWLILALFTEILLILPLLNVSVLSSGTKEQVEHPSLHPLPDGLDREGFRSLKVVVECYQLGHKKYIKQKKAL